MMKTKFFVRAFDTDYGFDVTWEWDSQTSAEKWVSILINDFGTECQAYWWKEVE